MLLLLLLTNAMKTTYRVALFQTSTFTCRYELFLLGVMLPTLTGLRLKLSAFFILKLSASL